jgi:cytochrome P450
MAIRLSSAELYRDPYHIFGRLRREEPVAVVEQFAPGPTWLVTRYDDVVTVLKDPRFSNERRKIQSKPGLANATWMPGIFRSFLNSMIMVDDPDHARLRNLVHKSFTPRMIEQLADRIEAISNDLLDAYPTNAPADLMAGFALPLPLTVISEMMGVPPADRLKFHKWTSQFLNGTTMNLWSLLAQLPSAIAMNRFFHQLITTRRKQPQQDLISVLVQAEEQGDRLNEDELSAMLFLLLLAGHETTVNLIGNGTLALLEHPEALAQLQANPDLMDSAIEEMLRFTNPVQYIAPRYALEEVDLHGYRVPKGGTVMVAIASANRDESVFANPDHFDITRTPNRHLAFGHGIHYCLGAPLARIEAKIAFQTLFRRYPNFKLAVSPKELVWRKSSALRGLVRLPVWLA